MLFALKEAIGVTNTKTFLPSLTDMGEGLALFSWYLELKKKTKKD